MRSEIISRSKAKKLTAVFVAAAMTLLGIVFAPGTIATTSISLLGADIDGDEARGNSGHSVSLTSDGKRVAIGANLKDAGGLADSGQVRIFDWNSASSSWIKVGQDIDGEAAQDRSGSSVSLSSHDGSRVAIGAPLNNGGAGLADSGQVRIYQLNAAGDWIQLGQDIDGERVNDKSGGSVSLNSDGSRVAIGAIFNQEDEKLNAGHVRIYDWNKIHNRWDKVGEDIDGEAGQDQSGVSVSLSSDGRRVAIGAKNHGSGGLTKAGHVRIYQLNADGVWIKVGEDIYGERGNDESGSSVSLSSDGNRVAIGSILNDDGPGVDAGHVRIYEWTGGAGMIGGWIKAGEDINGEADGDFSGASVSLSSDGSRVAIGASRNDGADGAAERAGHVRIYEWTGGAGTIGDWIKVGEDIDGERRNDNSGGSVSLSSDGSLVAIGAIFNSDGASFAGHTRVFSLPAAPALTSTFGTATRTADGLTVSITNYDPVFTFVTPTVDTGSVSAAVVGGDYQIKVKGLTPGQSVVITQRTTRDGYANGSTTFEGSALLTGASIPVTSLYSGPLPTGISSAEATAGDKVIISGKRLSGITSVTIDGLAAEISNQSAGSLTMTIPLGLEPGLKDIRILSGDGNLTYLAALEIVASPTVEEPLPAANPTEKLNVGSFQGYVAVYAKGYEGQKLSAKVAGKWLTVDSLGSGFERILRYTGAGYQIKVDLYINGILLQQMEVTTK